MLSESHSGGTLNTWSTHWTYDSYLRKSRLEIKQSTTVRAQQDYAYDTASRLQSVTSDGYSATYSYLANSPLVEQISCKQVGYQPKMTLTRQFDYLDRLQSISSVPTGETLSLSFAYQYNSANQRVKTTLSDGSYWIYTYDTLGQVTSSKRYWNNGTPVAGQQFEYGFDDIGNRTSTKQGGDQTAGSLRPATYTANNLNQYDSRTIPGYLEVQGIANPSATLTINSSSSGIYRRGEYFRKELTVANSSNPILTSVSVSGTYSGQSDGPDSGGIYLGKATETFTPDLDGNLTSDSLWDYVWDAENRLISMSMKSGTGISGTTRKKLVFEYDWQGRRIKKQVYHHDGGTGWTLDSSDTRKFVYDGWNLICELAGSNNPVQTYVWGLDLSGSLYGAGGVGGLLMVFPQGTVSHHYVAYDGNGNVAGLVNASDGTYSARYEYGPFGELLRSSGTQAKANPIRFSTKYQDDQSGFLYYGYRYYNPSTGRWLSRDPIEERGGINLYGFVENAALNASDVLGRDTNVPLGYSDFDPWPYAHPNILLPELQPQPTVKLESPIAGWIRGFAEGLRDALTTPAYLKCQAACSVDKTLNALLNPVPGVEFNVLAEGYGGEYIETGFNSKVNAALEAGKVASEVKEKMSKVKLEALTQKQSIERMIELLNRKCSRMGPRAARVLQENLAKAESAENALVAAEMLKKVAQVAVATKGFYDCYEKHCASCLEKCATGN